MTRRRGSLSRSRHPVSDSGSPDLSSTDRMVDFALDKGLAGLMALGAAAMMARAAAKTAMLDEAPEQERREAWITGEVERGAVLPGPYPPNAENKARYEADAQSNHKPFA